MKVGETLYRVKTKEVDFKNMPNNEEFYFVIDLAYGKRVHRCGHIKTHPNNFLYVLLDKTQLTDEQRSAVVDNCDAPFSLPDIRNKLSPIKNLIAMLDNGLIKGNVEMHDLVLKEIEACKQSIAYLSGHDV